MTSRFIWLQQHVFSPPTKGGEKSAARFARTSRFFLWAMAFLLAFDARLPAQTSYPMITHVTPIAVQRGKTTEVSVEGTQNFQGAHTFLIEGKGVVGQVVAAAPSPVRAVKVRIEVAPDASLGVREFRLATDLGISTLGQLLITDDPVVLEAANNDTLAKAQPIVVPCVVSGRLEAAEDVDCFRFQARAGQTITCEVFCARIEDKIHDLQKHADPLLALYDREGRELAASDDAIFADPLLSYTIKQDGEYTVMIRDAKFEGDPRWAYALAITHRPYAAQIYPLAMNPGQNVRVEPIGSAKLVQPSIEFQAPSEPGMHSVQLRVGSDLTNPVTCIVTPLPLVMEQEPNDTPEQANRIKTPCGINGRIGAKRDFDHFVFQATKGRPIRFEVFARRFGTILTSPLDSMLDVLNKQGTIVASNDDANGKDSALVFTPPADGDYVVRIRDLNSKGGDSFVYYLEADWAKPDFTLKCDPSKAMLGPGGHAAWYVQAVRSNGFAGPIKVEVKGLPPTVTVNPLVIPPTMTQGLLVLSAAPGATPLGFNVIISGRAFAEWGGEPLNLERKCVAVEEIYSPGGGRARFDVRMQSVAVTRTTDVTQVRVKPENLVVKPGDEVKIEVEIERRKDFDNNVNLDVPLRHLGTVYGNSLPPGVTVVDGKSKTILGKGSKGHITLKIDPKAALIDDVPISVQAHVSVNFVVKVGYSSPPILLSIRK
jgi:hypothetical protein